MISKHVCKRVPNSMGEAFRATGAPQRMGDFQLNSRATPTSVADIVRMSSWEGMAIRLKRNVGRLEARADTSRQHRIAPADVHAFMGPTASMHCHHMVGLRQQGETPWLVKTMTGQVQRVVVVRWAAPLEEIEVMFISCNSLRDFRSPVFDPSTMGRENSNACAGPTRQRDREMLTLTLGRCQILEMPVMGGAR